MHTNGPDGASRDPPNTRSDQYGGSGTNRLKELGVDLIDVSSGGSAVADGLADAVFLARVLLRHPGWIRHAIEYLGQSLPDPPQYSRAFR